MISCMLVAIAYVAMAAAVSDFFMTTEESGLGRQRWLIMGVLAAGVGLQILLMLAMFLASAVGVWVFSVGAGLCLMAVPAAFWPVVARLKGKQLRVLNRRLALRVQRAEAAAADSYRWLCQAEQSGHVGHWQLTVPGNRLLWSDEIFRIHGLWKEHYQPRFDTALTAFHPADGKRVAAALQNAVSQKSRFEVAARLRRPDGESRHVILRGEPQLDFLGHVEALAGIMLDVTEPTRAAAKFLPHAHQALRDLPLEDSLTGLPDRRQFDLSLGYEFKRAVRSRKPFALVLIDIDRFRSFNNHYGEMEGDACLRRVAQAIQQVPRRTGDVVARYRGAEIAVLLPLADAAGAMRVAGAIAEVIRVLAIPHIGQESGNLTVSCGAAAFGGMEDLYNPLELTRRATRALDDAKIAGGDCVRAFNAETILDPLTP